MAIPSSLWLTAQKIPCLTGRIHLRKEDDDEPNAAIFAKDDLTFNGSGSLIVTGNYNHAIQSKDALKFVAGTFDITSVGDGLVGKDSISVKDGIFTITSAGDGIKSTNIEETDKGYIMIDGGTFQIQSENDAMQAETLLRVNDGTFDILTNGTGQNMTQNSDSAKALKSYVELTVAGGKFTSKILGMMFSTAIKMLR
ncbi:MAG: carbohydrate-binding domain-containing protein [Lachnoclostridium sp.]